MITACARVPGLQTTAVSPFMKRKYLYFLSSYRPRQRAHVCRGLTQSQSFMIIIIRTHVHAQKPGCRTLTMHTMGITYVRIHSRTRMQMPSIALQKSALGRSTLTLIQTTQGDLWSCCTRTGSEGKLFVVLVWYTSAKCHGPRRSAEAECARCRTHMVCTCVVHIGENRCDRGATACPEHAMLQCTARLPVPGASVRHVTQGVQPSGS